jgi:hypothetical protein
MITRTSAVLSAICASLLVVSVALGQTATLQGDVKGVDGRAAKGAEVRIERQDKKGQPVVVKTDSRGRFAVNSVAEGSYTMTAVVAGGLTSPAQAVKARKDRPVIVNFDLRGPVKDANGKPKKQYVWMPDETGSHLGGRYVEVDQANDAPNTPNSKKATGKVLQRIQNDAPQRGLGGM